MLSKSNSASYLLINHGDLQFKFLVDTGASISLIKTPKLKQVKNLFYNPNDTVLLNGLSVNGLVDTVGSISIPFKFFDHEVPIKFYIVRDNTNVPFDGLIGNDFLLHQKAQINYEKSALTIKDLPFPLKIHFSANIDEENCYYLPPRSETIVEVGILNKNISEGLSPEIQLCTDVYLAKALLKVNKNGKAFTTILNASEKLIKINKLNLYLEEIPYLQCYHLAESSVNNFENSNRLDVLQSNLRLDHLNSEEKSELLNLCKSYSDIFFLPNDCLTHTETLQHEIKTTTSTPISTKIYRFPKVHETEVDNQINRMLNDNIIRPSSSPYNSPLWVVPKGRDKDSGQQKWRIVTDYRKLNNVTVGDSFPIPNIDYILDQLGHSKYFTTLDLASGFNQILIKPEDVCKTAFSTPQGHYEYLRMPFGLKNAPATFSRLMKTVLTGLEGSQCFTYLDDTIVYASCLSEHNSKLEKVFNRLRINNLKLQPEKCEFLHREVSYLGHIITADGVKPNPEKIRAIVDYPKPVDSKSIKQFLGLMGYYRKFIKNFSTIAKPLTSLLQNDVVFVWNDEQEDAFQKLKNSLITEPILQYPDYTKPFILSTDASNSALGAVLSQGEIGNDLPISFASRTLNKAEIHYSTTEKELLAIVWATKHFRTYLYGQKFVIVTDHRPLIWLFNCKDPSSRLIRWRLKLEEYDYDIHYKPGCANSNADALYEIQYY